MHRFFVDIFKSELTNCITYVFESFITFRDVGGASNNSGTIGGADAAIFVIVAVGARAGICAVRQATKVVEKDMKKIAIAAILTVFSACPAFAFTDCSRSPSNICTDNNGIVWLCFASGDGGCVYKSASQVDASIRESIFSLGISAITARHEGTVRFPESGWFTATTF